jgi:hypothetical protein
MGEPVSISREELIEQVVSAFRETGSMGQVLSSPAWHDLDEEGRQEAFERALVDRRLLAAADPQGLSPTAKAVLKKIRG